MHWDPAPETRLKAWILSTDWAGTAPHRFSVVSRWPAKGEPGHALSPSSEVGVALVDDCENFRDCGIRLTFVVHSQRSQLWHRVYVGNLSGALLSAANDSSNRPRHRPVLRTDI